MDSMCKTPSISSLEKAENSCQQRDIFSAILTDSLKSHDLLSAKLNAVVFNENVVLRLP